MDSPGPIYRGFIGRSIGAQTDPPPILTPAKPKIAIYQDGPRNRIGLARHNVYEMQIYVPFDPHFAPDED